MNATQRRRLVENMNDSFINRQMTSAQREFQLFYTNSRDDIFEWLDERGSITKRQVRSIMVANASLLTRDPLILRGIRVNLVLSDINNVITNPSEEIDPEIKQIIKESGGVRNTKKIADNSFKFSTSMYSSPYFIKNKKIIQESFTEIKKQRRFTSRQLVRSTQNYMTAKINEIMRNSYSSEELTTKLTNFYKKAASKGEITLFRFKDGKPTTRKHILTLDEKNYFKSFDKNRILRIANTELNTMQQQVDWIKNINIGHTYKRWINEGDNKVRDSHKGIMGVRTKAYWIPINEAFRVGREKAQFPGQNTLSPKERINCRCSVIYK